MAFDENSAGEISVECFSVTYNLQPNRGDGTDTYVQRVYGMKNRPLLIKMLYCLFDVVIRIHTRILF